ncbi:MAG: glycosyltransferase [Chthoniobacterales bacterium]|nr:glycosyltransferase [Chthoniobacterales bacterium]
MRIAVIFHRFGPYHDARLRSAAKTCETVGIELAEDTREYAWDRIEKSDLYKRVTVFPSADSREAGHRELRDRLISVLAAIKPDAVGVPGWSERGALVAIEWCNAHKVPVILMSESGLADERRSGWREAIKRRVVKLCSAALVGGQSHARYLIRLGVPTERIFTGYDTVDNDYFATKSDESRSREVENRVRHDLPESYFLANARFIAKKNLSRLIEAYARYRSLADQSDTWDLVILGDGPLKPELSRLIADFSLEAHVLLPGFKQYRELPVYYGLAKVFIHASTTEQWGLVVNEAMASGLPVLVSERCGCAEDLVREGHNGFAFDPSNTDQMAQLMKRVAAPDSPLAMFGVESRRVISRFAMNSFGEGLRQAADMAIGQPIPRARFSDRLLLRLLIAT